MVNWRFVLTDRNYVPVGEILNASDRRVARPISKLSTASFKVRLDNPLALTMLACDGYVKAYRDTTLMFYGPIISAEITADDANPSVAVNCVDVGWFLGKRLVGKSNTGTVFGSLTDRAVIAQTLIANLNSEVVSGSITGEMGLASTLPVAAGSAITYTAGPYKYAMECITELATAYDGFEWKIDPIENYSNGAITGYKIGNFLAQPRPFGLGALQEDAIFEWGIGRNNIKSFRFTVSRDTQANRAYHNVPSGPDTPGYPTLSALDLASITNYKVLDDLAQVDLTDAILRQQYLNEDVRIRKNPRQIIEFTPHIDPNVTGRVPQYGVDYEEGDIVRGRAVYGGQVIFDAYFRLWGVMFEINNLGVETGTMALAEESS